MKILFYSVMMFISACSGNKPSTNANNQTNTQVVASESTESAVKTTVQNIDVAQFKSKSAEHPGTILDVRTPEETAAGTIPGAVIINFYDSDFEARASKLDKTKPVYVYCKAGGRSAQAASMLAGKNFSEVYNILGGYDAYKSSK